MDNKPLPQALNRELFFFHDYFYEYDRLAVLRDENEFINFLPSELSKSILVGYMFDDFFSDFRKFFRPDLYIGIKLLEEVAYHLKPRFFKGNYGTQNDNAYSDNCPSVIYREGGAVQEMLFFNSGECAVGYSYYQNNQMDHRRTHLTHAYGTKDFIGGFYILFNLKSSFHYEAKTDIFAYSLSKYSFMSLLNNNYPMKILREF